MSGLLAAETDVAADHLPAHVGVADRATVERDARLGQRRLQPEVAHHRRHDAVARQTAGGAQVTRRHEEHAVAVDEASVRVDQHHPVAVAVEREAETAALLHDRRLQRLGMRRAARRVDVAAVRRGVQLDDAGAEPAQDPRRHPARGPVRAVDRHRHPGERGAGRNAGEVIDVGLGEVRRLQVAPRRERVRRLAGGGVSDPRLDPALDAGRGLRAVGLQQLDAVVRVRVVGRGDHDAGVETAPRRHHPRPPGSA